MTDPRRFATQTPHQHRPHGWDGYFEFCRCGAAAGDRRDPRTGLRFVTFDEWGGSDD